MFCHKCGAKNEDDAVFCGECGTKLRTVENKVETEAIQTPIVPKKKMNPLHIVLIAEAVLILVFLIAVPVVMSRNSSPEQKAEQYFANIVNGNYNTAFKLLDLNETDFINGKTFGIYCNQLDLGEVSNYEVISGNDVGDAADEYLSKYSDLLGDSVKESIKSTIGNTVQINYRNKGDESSNPFIVNLNKDPKKKFLFFDNWSVACSSMVVRKCKITVLDGAKLTIDGIAVGEQYKTKSETNSDDIEKEVGTQTYEIPTLFAGQHTFLVTLEGRENLNKVRSISSNEENVSLTVMEQTQADGKAMQQEAVKSMQTIYSAAMAGKSFNEVKSLFTSDVTSIQEIESSYNQLIEDLKDENGSIRIEFKNIKATSNTIDSRFSITYGYTVSYKQKEWFTGKLEDASYDGSSSADVTMVKENGKWVLSNMPFGDIYY